MPDIDTTFNLKPSDSSVYIYIVPSTYWPTPPCQRLVTLPTVVACELCVHNIQTMQGTVGCVVRSQLFLEVKLLP